MIFVTVGTHEQPFDRLVMCIDDLKRTGVIQEEVIMQIGAGTYEPQYCKWSRLIPYQQMVKNIEDARIVITHGGPSTFVLPLQIGKIPVVVPRQKKYGEHVNDHQLEFTKEVSKRQGNIVLVEDVVQLEEIVRNYDEITRNLHGSTSSNNMKFCADFAKIVQDCCGK